MQEAINTKALDALAPYDAVRAEIQRLKIENADLVFQYETKAGNKAARSHIHALRQRKADVERVRKATKADAIEYGRRVDSIAKELTADVEEMIAVHQQPLDEIETREADRVQRHEENLKALAMPQEVIADSASCAKILERVRSVEIGPAWEEYEEPARQKQEATCAELDGLLAALRTQEAERAELERLRKEAAEREAIEKREREARERAEREARVAREAAERARMQAEEEAERYREQERRKAEKKLEREREKARQAQLEAERVMREAAEAEARRAREEQDRREEEERRRADEAHRSKVIDEITHWIDANYGDARYIAEALAHGGCPHVRVNF